MEISALQKERRAYQPKLPKALQGAVKVKEGAPTQSVDNQEEIKALFPNTYGQSSKLCSAFNRCLNAFHKFDICFQLAFIALFQQHFA